MNVLNFLLLILVFTMCYGVIIYSILKSVVFKESDGIKSNRSIDKE